MLTTTRLSTRDELEMWALQGNRRAANWFLRLELPQSGENAMQYAQNSTNALVVRRRWLPAMTCALLMAALSACGGEISSSYMSSMAPPAATAPPAAAPPPAAPPPAGCTASTCGAAVMTITDAAGVFLAYKVNLVSLQVKLADGTLVETLPATTAVDFVQLINLSEIISARQISSGEYSRHK